MVTTMNELGKVFDELFGSIVKDFPKPETAAVTKKHRITTKDGHITIEGDFKSLTVNGKVINVVK
mgnify:CR=1 FL=1